jgi:repressor LexA
MKTLSAKRRRLLHRIAAHEDAGHFPTTRELASELGLAGVTSLDRMLKALTVRGYLHQQGGGAARLPRLFRVTEKGRREAGASTHPGLLPRIGSIPAGSLREALQECEEFVHAGHLLQVREGDFLLEVDGDSMIGDGILNGDWIQIRPEVEAHNNEIAAVQIARGDGVYESTLKHVRFHPDRKTVTLRASNPSYADMVFASEQVEIVGVYRGLIRSSPAGGAPSRRRSK